MPQDPVKKSGTLSLSKTRVADTSDGSNSNDRANGKPARKPASVKTGARAHHRTRIQGEQRRTEPAPGAQRAGERAGERSGERAGERKDDRTDRRNNERKNNRAGQYASARGSRQNHQNHQNHQDHHDRRARPDNTRTPEYRQASTRLDVPQFTAPDASETFAMFASCPKGLEEALANELTELKFEHVQLAPAGCRFKGNWHDVWRANLCSRLATRILVELSHAPIASENDLRTLALKTNWERWLGPDQTMRVDTSAIRSPMQSLQYCNLLVKDSVCDRLRDKEGARPSIDTVRPDVRVHVFLSADTATLYLDTSGESLFKRGWRFDKTEAPIRENLAAGLLALSGWQSHEPLFDPFCGSGTILIEAAWQALDIAPGINRPFAFERLRVHDAQTWQDMRREATERVKDSLQAPLVGCDLSSQAIDAAHANLQRAGLSPDLIQWHVADATTFDPQTPPGVIVTNPPYGERLGLEDDLMSHWATQLKQSFTGWRVNVISADLDLPSALRLKPKRRVPLYNGALDCRMFVFDMVSNQYQRKPAKAHS